MTFDSRARRAVQGIHRAVEVMEMSSTKTPQRLTRFDRYRDRKSRNQRIAALAVGIAVPVVLLIGAVLVLRSDRGPAVPLKAPSVTPTAPSVTQTADSGRTRNFKSPFTYTVPQGTHSGQGRRYFSLDMTDGSKVIVLSDVVAAKSDCSPRPDRGVGTSSEAMTTWLSRNPVLDATTPQPVTLGAATGSYVDVKLAADWNQSCPGPTIVTGRPDRPQGWDIGVADKERYYVLDLPSGDTVTIVIDAYGGASGGGFQHVIHEAAPVVESFRFLG
jgi:hypothetical protein